MRYHHLFDPANDPAAAPPRAGERRGAATGDRRDGGVYVYTEAIVLAINVGLATGRPILVRGPSGSGKSSLARNAARVLGWRYYERVITSRTQAHDLLWEVDHLRRLQDAQARELQPDLVSYVRPGVLWWAFHRESALRQAQIAARREPEGGDQGGEHHRAVVLLDEIDKADPDVPNNLLVPLGSLQFQVEGYGEPVRTHAAGAPLVFLTTNDERDLPGAFLRRCVELKLEAARGDRLVEIGRHHFPEIPEATLQAIAELISPPQDAEPDAMPSAAEYLDTVRASASLQVEPNSPTWQDLLQVTVWKHGRAPKAR
ncbi:MAG TPA: MoxR family ATPase [Thermoanaerobaculia bacterium]|jgi:MoxR-like ATPase|nr:MoxR family ATPase [Thermoanaerobaculia bacterium]